MMDEKESNLSTRKLNEWILEHILLKHQKGPCKTEDNVPIRKLFINNLTGRTTHNDLMNVFSTFGNVVCCFLRRNQGKRNYAFVTFDSVDAAKRASCCGIKLHKRYIRAVPANSWHQPDSALNQYSNRIEWQKLQEVQSNEQCYENYIDNDTTDVGIQMLNDHCLGHIFLQLPIVDRIRIERVCKRWRAVSHECWRSVKKLNLFYSMWGFPSHSQQKITTNTLRNVLLRCGRFLSEIDCSQFDYPLNQSTLRIIEKLCPNLESIDITGVTVSVSRLHSLAQSYHNITKFSLGPTTNICDMNLPTLFKVNKKLQYFKAVCNEMCGKCLIHLPVETMEEIVLESCTYLQENYLSQAFSRLQNLRSLTIQECYHISSNVIEAIGTHCTNLKIFEFSDNSGYSQSCNSMLHIANLTNLEVLKVNENRKVTDELLCNLALKCQQLIYIDISGCPVSNAGVAAIATLPKLEVLNMNYVYEVRGTNLKDMSNLKRLQCRGCNVEDKTITELITSAPRLELLDLSRCRYITNLTLKTAAAVTIKRSCNIVLKIFVGGSAVNLEKFKEISPFLQIVNVRNIEYY